MSTCGSGDPLFMQQAHSAALLMCSLNPSSYAARLGSSRRAVAPMPQTPCFHRRLPAAARPFFFIAVPQTGHRRAFPDLVLMRYVQRRRAHGIPDRWGLASRRLIAPRHAYPAGDSAASWPPCFFLYGLIGKQEAGICREPDCIQYGTACHTSGTTSYRDELDFGVSATFGGVGGTPLSAASVIPIIPPFCRVFP